MKGDRRDLDQAPLEQPLDLLVVDQVVERVIERPR